jgi:hypothetical protein
MKQWLLAALAILVPTIASAGEVPGGSMWTSGGDTVTVNIGLNPISNTVTVSVTAGDRTSSDVIGTPGEGASLDDPTCSASPAMNVAGQSFRVKGSKLQKKKTLRDGTSYWSSMRKVKKKDDAAPSQPPQQRSGGGTDEVVSLPH